MGPDVSLVLTFPEAEELERAAAGHPPLDNYRKAVRTRALQKLDTVIAAAKNVVETVYGSCTFIVKRRYGSHKCMKHAVRGTSLCYAHTKKGRAAGRKAKAYCDGEACTAKYLGPHEHG